MTSTPGGIIQALSASQAEEFDPEQVGGCPRRWRYHRIDRLPVPESGAAQEDGDAGHALFAMHYRGEALPKRARMLKAVRGALAKGELPPRAPGQLVESRFDGQPARDANGERLSPRRESTLWLGGVPWDGYVDLRFQHGDVVTVLDHKFSSDIHTFAKRDLLATVQMPVYALDSLRIWPDARAVELIHHYVSRRGVDSFLVRQLVTVDQIEQRAAEIDMLVARMRLAAAALSAEDVPGNRASCHTWTGCPFQSRCSVFKEKPKMSLNPDELDWLNVVSAAVPGAAEELKNTSEAGKPPASGAEANRATELEIASAAGALDPGDEDPFSVFETPKASVPQEQPPVCKACGTELNAENGSQRDGKWKHVGCPADTVGEVATFAPGAVAGVVTGVSPVAKCPDCPHPAHPGAACTKKRGRGACRCGVQNVAAAAEQARPVETPESAEQLSHLPTCVQNDAGKWLCMEGCTAGKAPLNPDATGEADQPLSVGPLAEPREPGLPCVECGGTRDSGHQRFCGALAVHLLARERDMHRRTLGELDASERALKLTTEQLRDAEQQIRSAAHPSTGWTGTLQVNVNLGPETLALLQRLLGVKP